MTVPPKGAQETTRIRRMSGRAVTRPDMADGPV
jgi:hypothetical protein